MMNTTDFRIDIDVPASGFGPSAADAVDRLGRELEAAGLAAARLVPACVVCSRAWSKEHLLPAVVPADRATIIRDGSRGYFAVVHCHGATDLVWFGAATPSDNKIRTTRAFAGKVAA